MLEFDGARKYYDGAGGEVRAVDDVSLAINGRELVALFGPSGSGKSTLLHLAAGLVRCTAGVVRFEGRDLAVLSKAEVLEYRRTKLGLVFQNFNLVPGLSTEENVALPLLLRHVPHNEAEQRARAALEDVGLRARARHLPSALSGGEQQRTAIARAVVGNPKLILADEPTGNLDSETGTTILDLLSKLPREREAAVVVVTHDARVADYADRVLAMRDGRLTDYDSQAATISR
ncbi:MAG TPA: ABC transporter ATP-binding protein [Solirubrobacteraceae bacterium]|jgi:putative ABC transport system ATP-binding protein|nr:ABC transporter ATP-binding protein [Solirubrobacteraceae bacterium]